MSDGHGSAPGEYRGGRQKGTKNKATIEQEKMISRAMGKLDRPLGKDVLAEVMVEFREMAKEQAEAARAGDKEAQQKRVYYQGTLETEKANYRALARRAGRRCLELSFSALRSPGGIALPGPTVVSQPRSALAAAAWSEVVLRRWALATNRVPPVRTQHAGQA